MLSSTHHLLNQTNPNLEKDCWLCLNPQPPFYIGLASQHDIAPSNTSCTERQVHITLGNLEGESRCFHSPNYNPINSPYRQFCKNTLILSYSQTSVYYTAPDSVWFTCTFGPTSCISTYQFRNSSKPILCIPVYILPRINVYSGPQNEILIAPNTDRRWKRAPIIVPLLVGLGIAGSTAIGISALVTGDHNFQTLSHQIDADIAHLESSITRLAEQVDSAEMVLQNRRRLDLLLLKEGGLCAALGEQCCFYANNSGIIRDSLAMVRKNLEMRKHLREASGNWYQKLFSWSPWLTFLLTGLAGPVVLVVLRLTKVNIWTMPFEHAPQIYPGKNRFSKINGPKIQLWARPLCQEEDSY
ncbi:endogenous retrovirus group S71 member 1 Env polyprotein-like [Callithrix jacchus]